MDVPSKVPVARLRVIMERSYDRFTKTAERQFLRDLARVVGCSEEDLTDVAIRRGCVLFEANLDEEAAKRLIELFGRLGGSEADPEIKELADFVKRNKITKITADYEVKLQIIKRTAAPRHVVFVHGWSGEPDSFGKLPEFLQEALGCSTSMYEYPTSAWTHSPSVVFIARNLDNWVRNHVQADRMAFVAHSYGGLVVRKFLVLQSIRSTQLDALVKQVTFVASPHDGSALANIGRHVPLLRSVQLDELAEGSPTLFELNELWQAWMRRMVPMACHVRSIFGTADAVVSATSARGLDPDAVPILGKGHIDIVKPSQKNDEILLTIERFLRESPFLHAEQVGSGAPPRPT